LVEGASGLRGHWGLGHTYRWMARKERELQLPCLFSSLGSFTSVDVPRSMFGPALSVLMNSRTIVCGRDIDCGLLLLPLAQERKLAFPVLAHLVAVEVACTFERPAVLMDDFWFQYCNQKRTFKTWPCNSEGLGLGSEQHWKDIEEINLCRHGYFLRYIVGL
jgi:hypothetical protein